MENQRGSTTEEKKNEAKKDAERVAIIGEENEEERSEKRLEKQMAVGMGQEERRKGKRKEERRRLCSGNGSSKCMELSVPCLTSIFNCLDSAWFVYSMSHCGKKHRKFPSQITDAADHNRPVTENSGIKFPTS